MSSLRRVDPGWTLVALFAVFAAAPLSAPGFFYDAHDATIGAYFLAQFDKGMADGVLYPRWAMDWTFGYGHPVFIVIAPLAFYVAQAIHLLGAGIISALKITYALAFLFSGLSMYLFAREIFGRAGGLLAAVLYLYMPYHLADIYVRGDLAEFAAFAFFPAVLWAIVRLSRAGTQRAMLQYMALGALCYGGLILTHITMAMIFTPVALAYALLVCSDRGRPAQSADPALAPVPPSPRMRVLASLALMVLGIVIGAAYLLPGVLEQRYLKVQDMVGGYYGYANHYVYPFQLFAPLWDFGYAAIGPDDRMPLQLGAVAVTLALCSLWAMARLTHAQRRQAAFFLATTVVVVFALVPASRPLWDLFSPLVSFVQFPWRLLALTTLSLAVLGGAIVADVERAENLPGAHGRADRRGAQQALGTACPRAVPRACSLPWSVAVQGLRQQAVDCGSRLRQQAARGEAAILLVLLVLLAGYGHVAPQYTAGEITLANMIQFQIDTGEMLGDTIWVSERPKGSPMVAQYSAGQQPRRAVADDSRAVIEVIHSGGASYEVRVTTPSPTAVLVQIRYYPGWTAYLDGQRVQPEIREPQGLMAVAMGAGEHSILMRFEDTPLRLVTKIVSLVGIAIALGIVGGTATCEGAQRRSDRRMSDAAHGTVAVNIE